MNVANQFFQVWVLLAENRFVSVLKNMAMTPVPAIELNSVSGQKPSHDRGNRRETGTKQAMSMGGHKCPRKTVGVCLRKHLTEPVMDALKAYKQEVIEVKFSAAEHSFKMPEDTLKQVRKMVGKK